MARECDICGKKPVSGSNISHAHNVTKRRFKPNLQSVRTTLPSGQVKKITACTACIKSGKVIKSA